MIFLETERLVLRNVEPKDAAIMYDYRNNDICARYQRGQSKVLEEIQALIMRRQADNLCDTDNFMLAVAFRESDELVGEIVVLPNDGCFSIGYTFHYAHHRKGYAFEALSALTELLHSRYPDMEFISFTETENTPSMKLLKKLGYMDLGYVPQVDSQMFGKWLKTPPAQDSSVTISPLQDADRNTLIDIFIHPEVKKTYMLPDFESREAAEKLFCRLKDLSQSGERFVMGVYADGKAVGFLNETENENGCIELGWVIHPDHHNKGYATDAVKLAISLLFARGYREVTAGAFEENPASIRVMEKAGMTKLSKTDSIDYRSKTHRCIYYSIRNTR